MKLVSATMEQIDRQKAILLQAKNTYESQRRLHPRRLQYLREEMKNGTFRTGEIGLATLNGSGNEFLVNGQHQLAAVIAEDTPIIAKVEHFECKDRGDLSSLFRRYDTKMSVRQFGDIVRVEMDAFGIDWPRRVAQLIVTGAGLALGTSSANTSPDKRLAYLHQFRPQGDFIAELVTMGGSKISKAAAHLMRGPVCASMILTHQKDENDADVFWTSVRDGTMLRSSSPIYYLRETLRSATLGVGGSQYSRITSKTSTSHEMLYKCNMAWNKWRREDTQNIATKYSPTWEIPKVI